MLKKFLAVTVALAMLAVMWVVPTSAEGSLADSLVFNADYTTGSAADKTGNFNFSRNESDFIFKTEQDVKGIITDSSIGSLKYTGEEISLGTDGTFETYFLSNDDTVTFQFFKFGGAVLEFDQSTGFGFYDSDIVVQGADQPGSSQYLGKWTHVVAVVENGTAKIYLNGTEITSGAYTTTISGNRVDAGHKEGVGYNVAFSRIYDNAATAEEVAALYAACPKEATETPTPTPTATPTPTPTPTPTATEEPTPVLPEVPTGEDFTITVDSIPAFKAGDLVKVKLAINGINPDGLIGLDIFLAYNQDLLELNKEATTSNASAEGSTWWLTAADKEINGEDLLEIDGVPYIDLRMADDSGEGITKDGELWIEVAFTAKADSAETGELIAYTMQVGGTLNDAEVSLAYGEGCYVYVEAVEEEPSASPSEPPVSEEPSEEPSASNNPTTTPPEDVPPTFDAGIISLAAVALSSVVAVKKRKIS